MIRTYLWGIDLSGTLQRAGGVGGLLKTTDYSENTTATPLFDGNGNIVQYVDEQHGEAIGRLTYDPFGNELSDTTDLLDSLPFRFSTKFTDDETGLIYYGFRYYNPETGRWLNRDPIEEKGGFNLYGFVSNDPVIRIDSDGRIVPLIVCGGVLVVALCGCDEPPNRPLTPDEIWDNLTDQMKEWFAEQAGGVSWAEAMDACSAIEDPTYDKDEVWVSTCQTCALARCAQSAKGVINARSCLTQKFLKCASYLIP